MPDLFDLQLRAQRRDRAARSGPELFLLQRAFEDCIERISLVRRRFERALLIGCPDPAWAAQLRDFADRVDVIDPGELFARVADGEQLMEDAWEPEPATYDLVLSVGTLDTVNDLQRVLMAVRWSMRPGGLFLGALSGGETLPRLRSAMRAADALAGDATPHVHPRIEASALAPLLAQVGFLNPVVDVDRVAVGYRSFAQLIADLRRMGATNILTQRARRPLSKRAAAAAGESFMAAAEGERVTETFEILHFACWSPPE